MVREYFNQITIIKISLIEITEIINKSNALYDDDDDGSNDNDNHSIDRNKNLRGNIEGEKE